MTMVRKKKKKRKSMKTASTKQGLKDQLKNYVNYAKDIIRTKVHKMEKKLKNIQQSKDAITKDGKKETYSEEKKESKVSEEMKIIENNSRGKKNYEKKNQERESLDLKDSIEISELIDDDDNYGVEKESPENLYKRHKHRRKKKKRKHLRNHNKKYKTNHKRSRKTHKKHRHNKHKKHHKHRHKKHHKYRYVVLEGLRRDNFRGRSDLYSVETTFKNQDNTSHSAENSQGNSRSNSENEGYNEDNNDYQALRRKPIVGVLSRNTRFHIVKNVRSLVSTSVQTEITDCPFHKRFNIIRNNENRNMTIISARLDIDKKKPIILNLTKNKEHIPEYSSSDSTSSIESSDGLTIDKWIPPQEFITTNVTEALLTTSIKPSTGEELNKSGKRKYFAKQQNLDNRDIINDTDYLSKNEEVLFSNWLRTVDRLKFTPSLENRKSYNKIISTIKSKYTTKNVKPILFFKASDEYDSSGFTTKTQKRTSSSEEDIWLRSKKHVTRRNNKINPVIASSRKPLETIKISLEISLENKDLYVDDTDKLAYHKSSSIQTKPVKNRNIRKPTTIIQSRKKGLLKNLAKQFEVLEKINKKFDKSMITKIHKVKNTEVTQQLDKQLDLDVWIPDSSNYYYSNSADKTFEDSRESHQNTDLNHKQNTSNTLLPATTSTRQTTENVKQTNKKLLPEYSLEVTTRVHKVKDTEKIVAADYEYQPLKYYSNILRTTDQTMSLKNVDLIELNKETGILKQQSKKPSFVTNDEVEFTSGEGSNVAETTQLETKIIRRNEQIENWYKTFNNNSTFLPKNIRVKFLKKLSEITNPNDTLLRQNKRLKKIDVSESSDEERILKSNIYKYFGDNERMKQEHDEFNKNRSHAMKGNNEGYGRRLDGIELKNDTIRSDTIVK